MKKTILCFVIISLSLLIGAQAASIKEGDRLEAVLELQQRLSELGYFDGEFTGYYGIMTTTAVRNFQTANSLNVTGETDETTAAAIYSNSAVTKEQYLDSLENDDRVIIDNDLAVGDNGADVKELQKYLSELGYFVGDCTGTFGTVTEASLIEFQTMNMLDPTGAADEETRALIESGEGRSKEDAENYISVLPVMFGDTGSDVIKVQEQLKVLGYMTAHASGYFDRETEAAVKRFQIANEIEMNGKADENTRALLNGDESISVEDYIAAQKSIEVKLGDAGYTVQLLKEELKKLEYFNGNTDRDFDETTRDAVAAFQEANDLEVTGIADPETRKLINDASGIGYEEASELYRQQLRLTDAEKRTDKVINEAYAYVGQAYAYGTYGANAYDSAGFTQYVYGTVDLKLKESSYEQGYGEGEKIASIDELSPGDLVVFCYIDISADANHVGIYLGNNRFIHASESTGIIVISSLESEKYAESFLWGKRVIQ